MTKNLIQQVYVTYAILYSVTTFTDIIESGPLILLVRFVCSCIYHFFMIKLAGVDFKDQESNLRIFSSPFDVDVELAPLSLWNYSNYKRILF